MKLTILGSGTYQPELKRHPASYLLQINKQNIVFDFGRGVLDKLLQLGINYHEIDTIFISHTHADHCSELSSFLHIALAEPPTGKFRKKAITIYGPPDFKKSIFHLLLAFDLSKFKPVHKVKIKELTNNSQIKGKGWVVSSYLVKHSKTLKCLVYRVKSNKKIFCYSGDSANCPGLRKACFNANLAVLETSWPKSFKPKWHLTGEMVGEIAKECRIKKIILTHIAPYYLNNFNVIKEVKEIYKGPVLLAKDLMTINI
jgi:ribonuclease BN (tRNA processing enzyme)